MAEHDLEGLRKVEPDTSQVKFRLEVMAEALRLSRPTDVREVHLNAEQAKVLRQAASLLSRLQTLEGENERLRGGLKHGALYLEGLSENLLRNDADMMLDECEDPADIAETLRSLLSPGEQKDGDR